MNNHNNIMSTNKYISTPNLPDNKVTTVIIDCRVSENIIKVFAENRVEVIKTKELNSLYDSVCSHPDMQIHHLGNNQFVCEPTLHIYYVDKLKNATVYKGNTCLSDKYPFDIAYNVATVGNFVFHNFKYTEPQILEYYKNKQYKLIDVKQGYSKCSVCVLNKNAIITSDKMIEIKAKENGIDALYVDSSDIKLKNLSNGFVGGICGKISNDILAIFGNINLLSDADKIINFCNKYSIDILPLNNEIPEDFGSIIPVF